MKIEERRAFIDNINSFGQNMIIDLGFNKSIYHMTKEEFENAVLPDAKGYGYRTITEFINSCIDDRLANYGLRNNTEYLSNVTESSRTNEKGFNDNFIDNDIKIDSRASEKHIATEEEETDNRMRLLKLQEEINARKACIIKPIEQEPTLTDIQLPDKPPF